MNLISAGIIKFLKKENDITQDSSVVSTKINFMECYFQKRKNWHIRFGWNDDFWLDQLKLC
jgi:hypothetical protein